MLSRNELLSKGLIGRVIPKFPYPERFCPYCDQPLTLEKAIHVYDRPEHYKAIFICRNKKCEVFDEPAKKAYAKVYYSTPWAAEKLNNITVTLEQFREHAK